MNQPKILVVEDDPSIRRVIVLALKSADYAKIAEVASGDAALEAAFRMRPDLVLLDIMLPGMDGLSVCRALRSNPETASAAIVMLTAKGADRDVIAGLDAGANDYIAKPFSKDVLLARIRVAHVKIAIVRNDSVHVKGDIGRLEEILENLIDNALRYSGSDRMDVSSAATPTEVTVSVTDFGIGIPAEHIPHIFERFYRVNKSRSRSLGGTGLGLAIVKHLVQLHGGSVSVVSSPGQGTTFSFTLSLLPHPAAPHVATLL